MINVEIDMHFVKGNLKGISINGYKMYSIPATQGCISREKRFWRNAIDHQSTVGAYKVSKVVLRAEDGTIIYHHQHH